MCSRYYVNLEVIKELQRLSGGTDEDLAGELEAAAGTAEAAAGTAEAVAGTAGAAAGMAAEAAAGMAEAVDVCPSQNAVLVLGHGGTVVLRRMRWGYPQYELGSAGGRTQRLLINARAETAAEKPIFRESLRMEKAELVGKDPRMAKTALSEARFRIEKPAPPGNGLRAEKPSPAIIPRSGRCAVPAAGFYEWNRRKEKAVFTHRESPVFYMAGLYRRIDGEDRFVVLTTQANDSVSPVHERMPLILEADELETWLCDDAGAAELLKKTPGPLARSQEYEQLSLF